MEVFINKNMITNGIDIIPSGDYKKPKDGDATATSPELQNFIKKSLDGVNANLTESSIERDKRIEKSSVLVAPPQFVDEEVQTLAKKYKLPPSIVKIMLARDKDPIEFLSLDPKNHQFTDLNNLTNSDKLQEFILEAIKQNSHIAIFYDYDVDGITSAVMLNEFIRSFKLGTRISLFPSNRKSGYGTNAERIKEALDSGAKTFFMLDFGTYNNGHIDLIHQAGCKIAVLDHHHFTSEHQNNADVFVNPMLEDKGFTGYCTGALMTRILVDLIEKIKERKILTLKANDLTRFNELNEKLLSDLKILGAFASVADMMQIKGDVRKIVAEGLREFNLSNTVWVRAMKQLLSKNSILASDIGFQIGPMINAAGRMLSENGAEIATKFFLEPRVGQSVLKALSLWDTNLERRNVTSQNTEIGVNAVGKYINSSLESGENFVQSNLLEVSDLVSKVTQVLNPTKLPSIIVLEIPDGHLGVLGIAAARIAQKFNRPTVLLAKNDDGFLTGSARSLKHSNHNINLVAGLKDSRLAPFLRSVGGHIGAAGLSLLPENFESFRSTAEVVFGEQIDGKDIRPIITADLEMTLAEIKENFHIIIKELNDHLEPCGYGNESCLVYVRNAKILGLSRFIESRPEVLALVLGQNENGNDYTNTILWTDTAEELNFGDEVNCIVEIKIDDGGTKYVYNPSLQTVSLNIIAIEKI